MAFQRRRRCAAAGSPTPAADTAHATWFECAALPARTTVPRIDWGRADLLVEIDAIAIAPGATK